MMDDCKNRVLRLKCAIQNYEWGHRGGQSVVGRLHALQSEAPLEPNNPYAELWMGTHDSGPSFVIFEKVHDIERRHKAIGKTNGFLSHDDIHHYSDPIVFGVNAVDGDWHANGGCNGNELPPKSMLLKDWLSERPKVLGNRVVERWGIHLPFLFKVISVQKALSIQAHPNKQLAEHLHRLHPNIYKDANHKPEMAFAITHFEALCGFVSTQELQGIAEIVPELQHVLGTSLWHALMNLPMFCEKEVKTTLKAAFTALMSANKDVIIGALTPLLTRLGKAQQVRSLSQKEMLILRLAEQYPGDVGILSALFLNFIRLDPGQAVYLDASEPHAYLFGDCLECMAASDNVVRAGLTSKYIDTKTLCDMLTYKQGMPEILSGIDINAYTKRYAPPFDEFEMDSCTLPAGQMAEFSSINGPSILLVLEGCGILSELNGKCPSTFRLQRGDILFISADTHFDVVAMPTSNTDLKFYRAGVNSRFLLDS
ncbi:hypothetical protein L7F22_016454 [Adiantum nelumboides]|nr:hypothetical protein [Adiantum nelumboides]